MSKLMIGLAAVFAVACTSPVEDVSHLDAHLVSDGVYGSFVQGEARLEFASFELEPGVFAVTIFGDGIDIDTLILEPGEPPPIPTERPMVVVDYGPQGSKTDDVGTFLLPEDTKWLVYPTRPMSMVDEAPGGHFSDLGSRLNELFPDPPLPVTALLRVLGPS